MSTLAHQCPHHGIIRCQCQHSHCVQSQSPFKHSRLSMMCLAPRGTTAGCYSTHCCPCSKTSSSCCGKQSIFSLVCCRSWPQGYLVAGPTLLLHRGQEHCTNGQRQRIPNQMADLVVTHLSFSASVNCSSLRRRVSGGGGPAVGGDAYLRTALQ